MPLNIDWQQILLHLLNFFILAFVLYLLLYKPVKKFMEKRKAYYTEMENKAKSALEDAEKSKEEYEERANEIKAHGEDLKKQAAEEVEKYRQSELRSAKEEAEKIIDKAKSEGEREKTRIIEGASKEITDIITAATEKIVLDSTTSDAYEQFLKAAERKENGKKAK